jgi:hypothetical protein
MPRSPARLIAASTAQVPGTASGRSGDRKEEQMRRAFKLATVFTGAAAIAGGYGPAALAATTQAATIPHQECGANNGGISNWVHLYYPNDDHPAECFHGTGGSSTRTTIASFCPGNNFGYFDGIGTPVRAFFGGQGRHPVSYWFSRPGDLRSTDMTMSFWSGHSKCT